MSLFRDFLNGFEARSLEGKTDVVSLIKADHRKVDKLFKDYMESSDNAEKEEILKEIINDLRIHAAAEEAKVYPTLDGEDHDGTNESLEEHHLIKILLEELSSDRLADDKIDAKVKVLSEVVKHHVKEEESKYLPELQDSGADLEELGDIFSNEKERLQALPEEGERIESNDDNDFRKVSDAVLADDAVEVESKDNRKNASEDEPVLERFEDLRPEMKFDKQSLSEAEQMAVDKAFEDKSTGAPKKSAKKAVAAGKVKAAPVKSPAKKPASKKTVTAKKATAIKKPVSAKKPVATKKPVAAKKDNTVKMPVSKAKKKAS